MLQRAVRCLALPCLALPCLASSFYYCSIATMLTLLCFACACACVASSSLLLRACIIILCRRRDVRVTINVLHACARDIQSRVRGRIVRATRQRECGAAARIQAWYHGWRVRARYSAVLQKMRTHRIERQKRMQVRPDHTRRHQTTPDDTRHTSPETHHFNTTPLLSVVVHIPVYVCSLRWLWVWVWLWSLLCCTTTELRLPDLHPEALRQEARC
jgi:hypothetical protein